MKAMMISFKQFLLQISRDSMLMIIVLSPIATGAFFKYGIPAAEAFLCGYFDKTAILSPYYLLVDIFLAAITPYMFCVSSALVILEERDADIARYLSVTPVGKLGYFVSRLVFPAAVSTVYSVLLLLMFSLARTGISAAIIRSISTAPIGIIIALVVVSLSTNKVEGMVFAKLGGLMMLGVGIPFLVTGPAQYSGAFLPSFWIAKCILRFSAWNALMGVSVTALWIGGLYHRFHKQIN